jgi:hypothetical protein
MAKLRNRDPQWHARLERVKRPQPHPLFHIVQGGVEDWEKVGSGATQQGSAAAGISRRHRSPRRQMNRRESAAEADHLDFFTGSGLIPLR